MLDPKRLRNELEVISEKLSHRGYQLDVAQLEKLEEQRKVLQVQTQALQNERNTKSKLMGGFVNKSDASEKGVEEEFEELKGKLKKVNSELKEKEDALSELQASLQDIFLTMPNIPHDSVPQGTSEDDNQVIRTWGEPKKFDFEVKDHVDLGESLKLMDFEAASKMSGSRFVVLRKGLARMHRALIQFMLDIQIKEHGYEEVYVPYLVKHESLYGTGQLPKFWDDQFNIEGESHLSLIPTAEVPVTNLFKDVILNESDLPQRFVAHTPCFRSEAGSYGKDTRGMIRQHQFEKVELVQCVHPEKSYDVLEEISRHAEVILQRLELPYQVVALCTGDLGFSSAKTYDLEVWLPAQNTYREVSSISNFEDFQARRLKARYRNASTNKPELVHTLNGSGLPAGRTLVAIIENYQDKEGRIHVPKALQPYMEGVQIIG